MKVLKTSVFHVVDGGCRRLVTPSRELYTRMIEPACFVEGNVVYNSYMCTMSTSLVTLSQVLHLAWLTSFGGTLDLRGSVSLH